MEGRTGDAGRSVSRRGRGRPRLSRSHKAPATVQALDRGIEIMRALARSDKATLTDLSLSVGMPPSTAHRILITLQARDFVEFHESTQEWVIGVEAFRIGNAFVRRSSLVDVSREILRRLVDDTGETANLAIEHEGDVVVLHQVETPNPIRAFFAPGSRTPMHASGIGKALLAEFSRRSVERILQAKGLPEFTPRTLTSPDALSADLAAVRRRGWALDDEERYSGMRCIAASIFNAHGEAIAGVSISGPSARFPNEGLPEMGRLVKRAADQITAKSGGTQRDNESASHMPAQ